MLLKLYGILRTVKITRHAAALAYYLFMSVASLLLVSWLLFDLIIGSDDFKSRLLGIVEGVAGEAVSESFSVLFFSTGTEGFVVGGLFGFILLVVSASMGYSHLQMSLDEILTGHRNRGLIQSIRGRIGSVFFLFFLFIVAIILIMLSSILRFAVNLGVFILENILFFSVLDFVVSFLFVYFFFSLIYRYLTLTRLSFKQVRLGSLVASILFMTGKYLFELYFMFSNISSVYAIAGYFIAFMIWLYFISLITLFGAVVIRVASS